MNTKLPKSRFAVPVAVATAFHAFLFFGFTPARPKIAPVPPVIIPSSGLPPVVEAVLDSPPPEENLLSRKLPSVPRDPSPDFEPNTRVLTGPVDFNPGEGVHIQSAWSPKIPGPIGISDLTGPIRVLALDHQPRVLSQLAPQYPIALRQAGLTGEVMVEFLVDPTGRVASASVLSSTNSGFEKSTLQAVAKWRFEPGKLHGRPVSFRMTIPIRFELDR
jgi:periplasmic protein TonB